MIVDENNMPVRAATREEMRRDVLWHRASYVYILTDEAHGRKLLVQRRTMKKDYCPGFFDLCTGGVVGHGEDDDLQAQREVAEEIGLRDVVLDKLKVVKCDTEASKVFANVYLMRDFDPDACPLTLQADEVDEVLYWSKAEIEARISEGENHKITPDSVQVFRELVQDGYI